MLAKTTKVSWSSVLNQPSVVAFPILAVIVIVGLSVFLIQPTIKSILDKREEIKTEQERLDKLVSKRQALEALSPEQMTQDLAVLNRVLPSRKPIVSIMGSMMGVATESGVVLTGYGFDGGYLASESARNLTPEKPGEINSLAITLGIDGLYDQVKNYLFKIQAASPLMKYLSASLDTTLGVETNPPATANLKMEAYFAPPPLSKGKITDPLPPMNPNKEEIIAKALVYPEYSIMSAETAGQVQFQKTNPFTF